MQVAVEGNNDAGLDSLPRLLLGKKSCHAHRENAQKASCLRMITWFMAVSLKATWNLLKASVNA